MKNSRTCCSATLVLALGVSSLHSAAAQNTLLDPLVITATRTEKKLSESPVRTQLVTRESLLRTQSLNLADALREVSGVQLVPIHGKPGKAVRLQGMAADHVLILIDGRPLSASTGSTVDVTQVTTAGVERIEIIKGPASALYGSSAMGGVINVITRKEDGRPRLGISAQLGSWAEKNLDGEPGNMSLSVNASHGGESWTTQLHAGRDHSNGFDTNPSTYDNNGAAGNRDNLNWRSSVFLGDEWELFADLRLYTEALQYRISSLAPGAPEGITKKLKRGDVARESITAGADGTWLDGELSAYLHLERFDETSEQDAIRTHWVEQSRSGLQSSQQLDIQWDKSLDDKHLLTLGFLSRAASLQQYQLLSDGSSTHRINDIEGKVERSGNDVFLQHDWFSERQTVELLSGLRYQHDSDFGAHLAPKLGIRIELSPAVMLRASVGEGYRTPNLKERHYVFDHSANGYQVLGNPALQPETNRSVQFDLRWQRTEQTFNINFFHHDLDQLIDTVLEGRDENGIATYRYNNIQRARIYGAELEQTLTLNAANSLQLDLARISTRNRETGEKLSNRPELQAGALWKTTPNEDISASLAWRYQYGGVSDSDSDRQLRHASIVNASAHWQLGAQTRLSLNLDNLGDSYHQRQDNSDLRPREGREVRLTINHQF